MNAGPARPAEKCMFLKENIITACRGSQAGRSARRDSISAHLLKKEGVVLFGEAEEEATVVQPNNP